MMTINKQGRLLHIIIFKQNKQIYLRFHVMQMHLLTSQKHTLMYFTSKLIKVVVDVISVIANGINAVTKTCKVVPLSNSKN